VENAELDVALEELENRLERLRALYEQYFMGIERIEPAIPRKDIDRRIYVLRREKIRNTAKRFKLQTIISRYNTFQQYWQRICREIESGTYKRHVIRAERIAPGKLLTIAARKRLGRHVFDEVGADSTPPEAATQANAAPSSAPPAPSASPSNAPRSSAPPSVPRPAPAAAPPTPKAVPPPKPGARPAKPLAPLPSPAAATARPFESLDLDMDFMGDWDPTAASTKNPKARFPAVPAQPFGEALARPLGAAPIPGTPPKVPAPIVSAPTPAKPGAASTQAIAAPKTTAAGGVPANPRPALAPPAPKPPIPNSTVIAPAPKAAPLMAGAVAPVAKLGAAPIARPAAAKPSSASGALSDDRVRELHARLVEAKRQTQDGAQVSVEGLAKSLKATEAKLREQHKNRKIDFDVVIRDGKAVLKPIVR
jgi:hypothetical protein